MTQENPAPDPCPQLSWIVPMYRTIAHLNELLDRVQATSVRLDVTYEIILVNDACPEGSGSLAEKAAGVLPTVRVVHHACNEGQDSAIRSGLRVCRGEWAVIIDGDLQDPPETVALLWAGRQTGVDAVFANRVGPYTTRGRRLTSQIYRRLASLLGGLPMGACVFVLMNRRLIDRLAATTQKGISLLAGLAAAEGRWAAVAIPRNRRPSGRSAYTGWGRLNKALISLWQMVRSRHLGARL